MNVKLLAALASFFVAINVFGQKSTDVLSYLKLDLADEIEHADFLDVSGDQAKSTAAQYRLFLTRKISENPLASTSSKIIKDVMQGTGFDFNQSAGPVARSTDLVAVRGRALETEKLHAIDDLSHYVQQRLGHYAAEAISSGQVDAAVFAGFDTGFKEFILSQRSVVKDVVKVPSLYEEWGIEKYLVSSVQEKPLLVFKVLPSMNYARHYATMLNAIYPQKKARVFFDNGAPLKYQKFLDVAAGSIQKQLAQPYDYVSFGYEKVWSEVLKNSTVWSLVDQQKASDSIEAGLNTNLLTLQHRQTKSKIRLLILSSDKTVWGELAPQMMKAFLHKDLKGVVFMGSAGAVSNKNNIYDLSVPGYFKDLKGSVRLDNIVSSSISSGVQGVNYGASHANTFSPIQQDRKYLKMVSDQGFDSIDVEQSLIARTVRDYNIKEDSNILFGAINLITDKPISALLQDQNLYSLDTINYESKQAARIKAVRLLLESINSIENQNPTMR
ncbi:MAG: hypothetical protein H7256_08750, partial [Bdellovibrio sp.]|nr:hypothetical protein [Bdellovibrio sp.]